jgi:hypothetical protein
MHSAKMDYIISILVLLYFIYLTAWDVPKHGRNADDSEQKSKKNGGYVGAFNFVYGFYKLIFCFISAWWKKD